MSVALRIAPGVAAGLLLASACGAAERAPAPSGPALGVCGVGAGAFLLPGTDACLTISGSIRAESGLQLTPPVGVLMASTRDAKRPSLAANRDLTRASFGSGARLTADLRVPTELGPLRLFVSVRGHNGAATDRPAR